MTLSHHLGAFVTSRRPILTLIGSGGGKYDFQNFERQYLRIVLSHTYLKDQSIYHKMYQEYIFLSTFIE
jgi:hypothetical protein